MTSKASDEIKFSTEAATDFVEAFYTALSNSRPTIKNYYIHKQTTPDGGSIPDILWNGNPFDDGDSLQKMFLDEMPSFIFYDVHAVDCQVLNPHYSTDAHIKPERNMSILVTVNGHLRLEDRKTGPLKDFSETFVLVPNVDKVVGGGKGASGLRRNWLIQLQNFRYVVHHNPVLIEGQVAMDVE